MFKLLTLIGINLVVALDLLPWLSLNHFKALVKKKHACILYNLMSNTKDKNVESIIQVTKGFMKKKDEKVRTKNLCMCNLQHHIGIEYDT